MVQGQSVIASFSENGISVLFESRTFQKAIDAITFDDTIAYVSTAK